MPGQKTALAREVIGRRTRDALQDYFANVTLRNIRRTFDAADINCDGGFEPTESGERRGLVQQYFATLDLSHWDDVRKVLTVCEDVLFNLEQGYSGLLDEFAKRQRKTLLAYLEKDGFAYHNGKLAPVGALASTGMLKVEAVRIDAHYLLRQIERIENEVEVDPDLAIGTSKELVETACTTILNDRKVTVNKKRDLLELVKHTREELKLVPDDVPDSAKAADTVRRLLGNLAVISQSLAELRNAYGTGHGKDGRTKGLSPRHARLAAGAACVLSQFLFDTHVDRG